MLTGLPIYISVLFISILLLSVWLFFDIVRNSTQQNIKTNSLLLTYYLTFWLVVQMILAIKDVYNTNLNSFPPNIMVLGVFPTLLVILIAFFTPSGKNFIGSLPLSKMTYFHTIRIPVEITLYLLFYQKSIPEIMTFEGRNFDIIAGITAPIVAYFGTRHGKVNTILLLVWNLVCLILLLNIVFIAIFSAPSPFQKFGLDQPNVAILNFPFNCLATFVVPLVLFFHLAAIKQLILPKKN